MSQTDALVTQSRIKWKKKLWICSTFDPCRPDGRVLLVYFIEPCLLTQKFVVGLPFLLLHVIVLWSRHFTHLYSLDMRM